MWLALAVVLGLSGEASPAAAADEALTREHAGEDAAAVRGLEAAVQANPTSALLRLELGRLVLKSGTRLPLAELHLDVARSLAPENPRTHYLYGLALDEQGRGVEARRALEVALALREDYHDARLRLAGLLFAQGDFAGAAAAYRRVLSARPDERGARLQLALALERSGAPDQAEAILRGLLAGPSRLVALRRLADLLQRQGRDAEAQKLRASAERGAPVKRPLTPSSR